VIKCNLYLAGNPQKQVHWSPSNGYFGNPPYSGVSANFTTEDFLAVYKREPTSDGGKDENVFEFASAIMVYGRR
jgi:hypothetical protein